MSKPDSIPHPTDPRFKDLTGQVFGRLTAVAYGGKPNGRVHQWYCSCSCGKSVRVCTSNLSKGNSTSCGCHRLELLSSKADLVGRVFGRLTVMSYYLGRGSDRSGWNCQCTCGTLKRVQTTHLLIGATQSCGCYGREAKTTHGRSQNCSEYATWRGMWDRCTNPNNKNYQSYQGRCPPESWRDFAVFYAELGPKPSPKHSLDRVNNDRPYGPGNCRWATILTQMQNKSTNQNFTFNGETKCVAEWARGLGLTPRALKCRISIWGLARALTTPRHNRGRLVNSSHD